MKKFRKITVEEIDSVLSKYIKNTSRNQLIKDIEKASKRLRGKKCILDDINEKNRF